MTFESPTLMSEMSHNSFVRQLSPFSMNGDIDDQLPSAKNPFPMAASIVPAAEYDEKQEQNDRLSIVADHRKEELKSRTFNNPDSPQDTPLCDEEEDDIDLDIDDDDYDENDNKFKQKAKYQNKMNTLQQPISIQTASLQDSASSSASKFGLNNFGMTSNTIQRTESAGFNLNSINEEGPKFSDLTSLSASTDAVLNESNFNSVFTFRSIFTF